MPEETIAEYRFRLHITEWSPLCDNIMQLDRTSGLDDGAFRKNRTATCSPPCEMCVTGRPPNYCEPTTEFTTFDASNEVFRISICELILKGSAYKLLFAGSSEFVFTASENLVGEDAVQLIADELQSFLAMQEQGNQWQSVTIDTENAEQRILSINYDPQQTGGTLQLFYSRT